ncbi:8621_t:CDS:2, partial [Gigaspora rosea]
EFSGSGSLSSSLHQGLPSYCVLELALLGLGLFPAVPMLFYQWSGPVGRGSFGIGLGLDFCLSPSLFTKSWSS